LDKRLRRFWKLSEEPTAREAQAPARHSKKNVKSYRLDCQCRLCICMRLFFILCNDRPSSFHSILGHLECGRLNLINEPTSHLIVQSNVAMAGKS
jgi:hypothetical protein